MFLRIFFSTLLFRGCVCVHGVSVKFALVFGSHSQIRFSVNLDESSYKFVYLTGRKECKMYYEIFFKGKIFTIQITFNKKRRRKSRIDTQLILCLFSYYFSCGILAEPFGRIFKCIVYSFDSLFFYSFSFQFSIQSTPYRASFITFKAEIFCNKPKIQNVPQ